jgi:flagellar basal body-associated protein FliL
VALALAAVAVAFAVVFAAGVRSGADDEAPSAQRDPISATARLSPRIALFGDTLTATVDVVVDRKVLDPEGVEVTWSDAAWKPVGTPERTRRDSRATAYVRTTYVLRCLAQPCVPVRETEEVQFGAARVSYVAPVGEGTRRLTVEAEWPPLVVHSRLAGPEENRRDLLASPWRADTVSLPAVSYRVSPWLVLVLLVVAGVLFVAAAAVILYRLLPEREPPPEPEPEPEPVATPLEQALALLEAPTAANGAQDRRRALELVAEEVERWGDDDLALAARTLAWSEDSPEGDETRALASRLRGQLERTDGVPA